MLRAGRADRRRVASHGDGDHSVGPHMNRGAQRRHEADAPVRVPGAVDLNGREERRDRGGREHVPRLDLLANTHACDAIPRFDRARSFEEGDRVARLVVRRGDSDAVDTTGRDLALQRAGVKVALEQGAKGRRRAIPRPVPIHPPRLRSSSHAAAVFAIVGVSVR
jgi:hypothetical protein